MGRLEPRPWILAPSIAQRHPSPLPLRTGPQTAPPAAVRWPV